MKNLKKPFPFIRRSMPVTCCFIFVLAFFLIMSAVPGSFAETKKANNVTFNFVDVDITAVTKFISEITGKNFIFDEKVKGKITIIAPSKLSTDDAYNLFTSVLELKGFTVVPSGIDAYKIIPSIEAKQRGLQISTEGLPPDESYMARLLTFRHIASDEALKFIQPLVSKDGHISTFGPGNLLLIVDSGLNIEKILSIAEFIDKPSTTDLPEIIPLKHSSADSVAKLLTEGLGRGRTRTIPGQPPVTEGATAIADQRLNAVILIGDKVVRESMKALISLVDVPSPEARGRINVYFLENADAVELSKVLEGMIKGMQASRQTPAGAPGAAVTPFEAAGGLTITPDKATNSLVIVASPADYQNLSLILKQLDKRRKQVFVEAMIVEASIDKVKDLGAKWRASVSKNGEPIIIGGVGKVDSTALLNVLQGLSGLTAGGMGNFLKVPLSTIGTDGAVTTEDIKIPGFAVLFSMNEFREAVNVLSTPQLLTSDNKEAEILVGENVPFITKRELTSTTTTAFPTSSIERQDVGIKLKLTPQITEGDYVKLDIYQEISSVKQESLSESSLTDILINVGPTTTKRSTKTSIVVRDNQTVVISGLMQEKEDESITKVPGLGDIPLIGYLFKFKSTTKKKTNLLVFLTPHIVKDADNLAQITRDKQKEFARIEKQYAQGELFLWFREGVSADSALAAVSDKKASVIKFLEDKNMYHIKLKKGQAVEDAIEEFLALPEVRQAEPNYIIRMQNAK